MIGFQSQWWRAAGRWVLIAWAMIAVALLGIGLAYGGGWL